MKQSIIDTIKGIETIVDGAGNVRSNVGLIDVLRPWLVLTGLEMHDFLHYSWERLTQPLSRVHAMLASVLGVLDEDQAQEAACRLLKEVSILGELIEDEGVAERLKIDIKWDDASKSWLWLSDPKLRNRASAPRFVEARDAVLEMLGSSRAA